MTSRESAAFNPVSLTLLLAAAFGTVGALTACGDDAGTGKVEETVVLDVEDVIDIITDIIIFETQETQVTTETTIETSVPDGTVETSPPDAAPDGTPDGQDGCRTFGCECNGNSDCLDELCIESADGNVCTRTCVADCPDNFDCLSITTFGDPVSVCVPRHTRLCRPCRLDAECDDPGDPYPAYCLSDPNDTPAGASGSFCGSSCANRGCPEGYACEDATLSGGGTAKQCIPVSGECTCRPAWGDLGYSTDCLVGNTFGYCDGTRSCGASGLTTCIGQQASPELCDGQDNDCNGATDDIGTTACYVQNEFGSCPGTFECVSDAPKCVGPVPQVEACNGEDDNCNDQVDENSCNDNLACTTDSCVAPFQCQNVLANGYCLVQGQCFQNGNYNPLNVCEVCDPAKSTIAFSQASNTCIIGGQCFPANAVNPSNACQICMPSQGTGTWSTVANTCQIGGQCYAANQPNPNNSCEICSPSATSTAWTQALNTCNIQGQCFAANLKNPSNECLICDPTKSASGWSNAGNAVSCEDGNACSAVSFCDGAGACKGDTACNDGISCTVDTCDSRSGCNNTIAAGSCLIAGLCRNDGEDDPTNQCRECRPTISSSAFSNKVAGNGCSDGNACTLEDTCNASGVCVAGGPKSCSDANVCTSDVCNPSTGSCTNPAQTGPCDDGNSCTTQTCSNGGCLATPIVDSLESNNSIGSAKSVSNPICDNGEVDSPAGTFSATLYGEGDVDWYKYKIDDDCSNSQPSPWVRLTNVAPNSNLKLCVYYQCDDWGDGDEGSCEDGGGSPATTFLGRDLKGCCSDAAGSAGEFVWYYPGCKNGTFITPDDDTGTAFVSVVHSGGTWTCDAYSVTFGDE